MKRGYKLWMIIDTNGYSNKFDVYQGKFEQVPEKMKCFGLGKRVVLSMVDHLHNRNHKVYVENYLQKNCADSDINFYKCMDNSTSNCCF